MGDVLTAFAHLIQEHRVLTDRHDNRITEYKARLTLLDGSLLEFSEINVPDIQKRKYAYQWMSADYTLIIRWDNALHHRHIATFPHHKHVGNEQTIEPSEEMVLETVLHYIDSQLSFR